MIKSSIVRKNLSSLSRATPHGGKKYYAEAAIKTKSSPNSFTVSSNSGGKIYSGSKHYVNNSATAQTSPAEDDNGFVPLVSSHGGYVSTSGHSQS
ncbi:hypothetical protein CANINC_003396 [Pichia inconspicua]|uniref:Uncharacterized protein n=1 Tax=Pichia inconspicua TaxID=52247 RepID=A0A4T0WZ69_9ASCO|nr:hypothetical protein CANINC_003396 [[Candida] inconspicua]